MSGGNSGGCAKAAADPAALLRLAVCPRLFVATDGDDAGDKAAATWSHPCVRRIRPPEGYKDWCEMAAADPTGLQAVWSDALGVAPHESKAPSIRT